MSATKFEVSTAVVPERAILVGVDFGNSTWPVDESLEELARLTETAGAEVVKIVSQKLESPNPRTFIGTGKAEEIAELARDLNCDLVVFDDELTPSQQSNLEHVVGSSVKVIDRTALILDIFALHATTREGRLQVRLAQNKYLYPRLRGMWGHLASNRMGGGVGSRFGEGESQLEVDRRLVRKRISTLRRELEDLASNRDTQRKNRNESGVFRIALAGYTNAGKSSLMNALTSANVLAYDKLFATLDSTTRQLELVDGCKATITDTVGFIQKLPHGLVESFRSTLDEIREASLILLVADISSKQCSRQIAAVQSVLDEIGAETIPTFVVYNKIDLLKDEPGSLSRLKDLHPDALFVSAATGEGLDKLQETLARHILRDMPLLKLAVPYAKGNIVEKAHTLGTVLSEEYTETGTLLTVRISREQLAEFSPYIVE